MSYEAALKAILSYFETEWAEETPVCWPNDPFNIPSEASWVRITVLNANSRPASLGGTTKMYRHNGIVAIQIFCEPGQGNAEIESLVDTITAIFRGKSVSGCKFGGFERQDHGHNEHGWVQTNINFPFYRDETFTI